jgi:hypothetical protein
MPHVPWPSEGIASPDGNLVEAGSVVCDIEKPAWVSGACYSQKQSGELTDVNARRVSVCDREEVRLGGTRARTT